MIALGQGKKSPTELVLVALGLLDRAGSLALGNALGGRRSTRDESQGTHGFLHTSGSARRQRRGRSLILLIAVSTGSSKDGVPIFIKPNINVPVMNKYSSRVSS